jgi:Xaa-Pro aminopeptidase
MAADTSTSLSTRLARLRGELRRSELDALVVTHPPNIRYLTCFSGSAGMLVVTGNIAELVVDFRYAVAARAAVSRQGSLDREGGADVTVVVAPLGVGLDDVTAERVAAAGAGRIGVEGQWISVARFNRLAAVLAKLASQRHAAEPAPLVATDRLVERFRMVKDEAEVATLRLAGRLLVRAAERLPGLVREGRTEIEVAADIDGLLRELGFTKPAFETIVAAGPNGALPHARPSSRRLAADEAVTLDFGGVYDGYSVDLTRTVELGSPSAAWRRLEAAVVEAHAAAIEAVRPGIPASHVDSAARDVLTAHGLGEAFGHATGHGLGLEVHEEPRIARKTEGHPDVVLEPGMVFTIEPGAYVEGIGGVRLEDDVLVTETGVEVLTRG